MNGFGYAVEKNGRWIALPKRWPSQNDASFFQHDTMGDQPGRMFDWDNPPPDIELPPTLPPMGPSKLDYYRKMGKVPPTTMEKGPSEGSGIPPTDSQRRRDKTVGMRHKDTGLRVHAQAQNSADRRQTSVDTRMAARDANTPRTPQDMEEALRSAIRQALPEVIRRKEGGGGWVLYAPNEKGKRRKKNPKAVGEFPTKAAARKAELARFPPKEPGRLKRMRKEIERLLKNPKAASAQTAKAARSEPPKKTAAPKKTPVHRAESLQKVISKMVSEELQRQLGGKK